MPPDKHNSIVASYRLNFILLPIFCEYLKKFFSVEMCGWVGVPAWLYFSHFVPKCALSPTAAAPVPTSWFYQSLPLFSSLFSTATQLMIYGSRVMASELNLVSAVLRGMLNS